MSGPIVTNTRAALLLAGAIVAIVVIKAPRGGAAPKGPPHESAAEHRGGGNAKRTPQTDANGIPIGPNAASAYTAQCSAGASGTASTCGVLHAAVVNSVVDSLETLRDAHDQRGIDIAIDALSIDQPAIDLAALQILETAPTADAIVAAAVPSLLSADPSRQHAAAEVISHGNDDALNAIAAQWQQGHPNPPADVAYDLDERTLPAAAARLAPPAGGFRYAPADGPTAIGWRTADSLDQVVARYARGALAGPLDAETWAGAARAAAQAFDPATDPETLEMQRLMTEYARTSDPKLVTKIQQQQQRVIDKAKHLQTAMVTSVFAAPSPGGDAAASMRVFVLEGPVARPLRAVRVYREEALRATIVQLVWDAATYPTW